MQNDKQTYYINTISEILTSLITEPQTEPEKIARKPQPQVQPKLSASIFTSKYQPSISLRHYIFRLKQKFSCQCSTLILAILYLDRYSRIKNMTLTMSNIYKLYLSSLVLASKFVEDVYFNNKTYCLAGGVQLEQLNNMEIEMFETFQFNLMFNLQDYLEYETLITQFE